jgi:hypothetical protein
MKSTIEKWLHTEVQNKFLAGSFFVFLIDKRGLGGGNTRGKEY